MAWRSISHGCLGLLCGLPAAGKSTLAKQIQEHAATVLQGDLCVFLFQYDQLIPTDMEKQLIQQSAEQGGSHWKSARSQIQSCVDCLINRLVHFGSDCILSDSSALADSSACDPTVVETVSTSYNNQENLPQFARPANVDVSLWYRFVSAVNDSAALTAHRNCAVDTRGTCSQTWLILIDDNMHYSSMRYEYCQLARRYEIGFCVLYLHCPMEVALMRNHARPENKVADHVITTMHERFEAPDPLRRSWEKYNLAVCGETFADLHLIFDIIKQAMADPQHIHIEDNTDEKVVSRFVCSTNTIHQADQILRKCISQRMANAKDAGSSKEQLKHVAADLSHHRTSVLEDMRKGEVSLPFDPGMDSVADASKDSNSRLYQFVEQLFLIRCKNTS
ncbi:hypothetical protein BaRGS_00022866 [Batillaria attramentaria]|uniref:L-seryl-tRNA(Sec) kinase n=1 Tax=Batillaria attramentaria TaxID=370345 RepID=A0ABD0KFY8_9CAEN